MKDSSVGPAGLFDIRRGRRLLASLETRSRWWSQQQQQLLQRHETDRALEHQRHEAKRLEKASQCRQLRREMLSQWDDAEERLIHDYETASVKLRQELNRLTVLYRRKVAEERKTIERKVDARRQAVLHQYDNHKNQPGQQKRKEIKSIDEALTQIREDLEWSRALTIRRLDRLPDLDQSVDQDDSRRPRVETVPDAFEAIDQLTRSCRAIVLQMQTGAASRIVDTYYLPAGVVLFLVLWATASYFLGPDPPWLLMAAGIPVAGVLGFTTYLVLLWPLKTLTRQLYPRVERTVKDAEACAEAGRRIATRIASVNAAELIQRRDAHLDAAYRWKVEHLAEMEKRLAQEEKDLRHELTTRIQTVDQRFGVDIAEIGEEMRSRADNVAETISGELSDTDRFLQRQRDLAAASRLAELKQLRERLHQGIRRGINRILATDEHVAWRFPEWQEVLAGEAPVEGRVDFLPVGRIRVSDHLRHVLEMTFEVSPSDQLSSKEGLGTSPSNGHGWVLGQAVDLVAESPAVALLDEKPVWLPDELPQWLPLVLHRRLHSGLIITCPPAQISKAVQVVHQILWRLLTGSKPGRAKLTLLDPIGRGQNFTSFMAIADHDPSLVGHRVWTTESKIEARLAELAHHVEDILQTCLRDRFARIEDYNEFAGSMAEPYRAIAAIGLPEGLSREGYKYLRALLESGGRCGITTLMVCDQSKPWPPDMPSPAPEHLLRLSLDASGNWRVEHEGVEDFEFLPWLAPPASSRTTLASTVGQAAAAAARVEIPLESILSVESEAKHRTDQGIEIPIGSQGANRTLALELGEGVQQHVLIAGKTGSGKSTLLHAIITAGLYRYRPHQLQFYLLDFKKGVEFKSYADSQVPHMRVIGIESEREFGRSVLQRLDSELQRRGEWFRAAAAQELADYRQASGKELPRLMLVIDEFQELFVRDDRLAADCALLLDRLVRQGRSFGIHVVLSSQSLAGAYSLPRATLGQMAVRIAMQCSEADAAMILADDNTAARLLSRPGEAIYNGAGGLVEGNQPFQVAWLSSERHREMLRSIAARDRASGSNDPPTVVFEGNRPAQWTTALAESVLPDQPTASLWGLLGEAVEISPPVAVELNRNPGRNVLLVGGSENRSAVLASLLSSLAKSQPDLSVVYFDGARADDPPSVVPWLEQSGITFEAIKPRDCETRLRVLSELVTERGEAAGEVDPIVVVIDPLDRFRDLRQDDGFSFSLDAAASVSAASALQTLLREGPAARVFVVLVCHTAETLSRWLPRASQHDLELRVLGVLNASDSSMLIDSPAAADLSAATMLLYDDAQGKLTKFRFVDQPPPEAVREWLGKG